MTAEEIERVEQIKRRIGGAFPKQDFWENARADVRFLLELIEKGGNDSKDS